jgi:hypothetical protein
MLSDKLDLQITKMDAIIKTDLPRLVAMLQKQKLDTITVTPLKTDTK